MVREDTEAGSEGAATCAWMAADEAATRGLLEMGLIVLNLGQVTSTTPELALPSLNYHTTPTGGRLSSQNI
ncbi:hypothetical protein TNCV_1527961 [Trichonephila clavipes]|nr:hypothetical protein TNCV_1527961 [Trichonephila clavipes]